MIQTDSHIEHNRARGLLFLRIASAAVCVFPEAQGDFQFGPMIKRVADESSSLNFRIVLGKHSY